MAFTLSLVVEAQVSVRRTPKKSEQSTTVKTKTQSAQKKAQSTQPKAEKVTEPIVQKSNVAVKRTITTKQQPANVVNEQSSRRQIFDEYQARETQDQRWQRVIYRELDLTEEPNSALYYPLEPTDGLTNLFRVIMKEFLAGNLKCYEYLDGREVFTDQYLVNVKDILDKFQIYYEVKTGDHGKQIYKVEDSDLPCNELLSYYIKERWEFDKNTSIYAPHTLAICPVIHRAGDFGGETVNYPLFWIDYEQLRPYLREQFILSDGMNNAVRYTMEDFFTLAQYKGDIYKVQNTRGLTLMQMYPDEKELKAEREKIESELHSFGEGMWIKPEDSEAAPEQKTSSKKDKVEKEAMPAVETAQTDATAEKTASTKKNRRTKETVKTKSSKSSTTTHSVRRTK